MSAAHFASSPTTWSLACCATPAFTVPHSGFEMLMLALVARDTVVQVPVNYHPRIGTSAVTGDTRTAIRLGLQMLWIVLVMRIRPPRRQHRPAGRRGQDQAARQQALWNPLGPSDHGALGRKHEDAGQRTPMTLTTGAQARQGLAVALVWLLISSCSALAGRPTGRAAGRRRPS